MKRVKDILITVLVSFEFLCALGVLMAYPHIANRVAAFAIYLGQDSEKVKWLALIPVALLGLMIKNTKDLLFPESPNARLLHEWPGFVMVKDRFIISLAIGTVCSIFSVGIWTLAQISSSPLAFIILLASIAISIITFGHFHLAAVEVRCILNAHRLGGEN